MPAPPRSSSESNVGPENSEHPSVHSEPSSVYHTAPFVQSSLQHGESIREHNQQRQPLQSSSSASTVVNQDKSPNNNEEADENSPLLSSKFKDPPTIHECNDIVNANELVQRPAQVATGEHVREAADELNSLLSNSNVILNGGITSPATLSWLIKSFLDLYYEYPNFSHLIISLTLLCVIVYFYLTSHGEIMLSQALYLDLESLSVTGVSDLGVDVHVATSIKFDYSQVLNWFNRFLGITAGILLGEVVVKPLAPIDVFVEIDNFEDLHRILRIVPHKTKIKLGNRALTTLDLDSTVGIISTSAVILLNRLVELRSNGQEYVNISVSGAYNFDVQSNLKNYRDVTYNFEKLLSVDLLSKIPGNILNQFELNLNDKTEDVLAADIKLETNTLELPIDLQFPSLLWNVLLPLCRVGRLVEIGDAVTDPIRVQPLSKISAAASIEVSSLPQRLVKSCNSQAMSPLNQVLIDFLSNRLSRSLYIVATNSEDNDIPVWLQFILERVNIPISLGIDQFKNFRIPMQDYIRSVEVFDTSFELNDSTETVLVSSYISLSLDYPSFLQNYRRFNINSFKSVTSFMSGGSNFTKLTMDNWQPMNINYTDESIVIDIKIDDLEIDILDPAATSMLLNLFLSGELNTIRGSSSTGVHVDSPIFETSLEQLPLAMDLVIPGLASNGGLSNLNTTIGNIFVIESSKDSATLLMDLEVENPLPYQFNTRDLPIDLYFAFEEIKLGEVKTNYLPVIPPNGSFNASVFLDIRPKTVDSDEPERAMTKLEKFLSSYLSGNDTDLTLIGHKESIPSFKKLSDVLADMSLNFLLPKAGVGKSETGFIVSSTMHIMTSEIEFTVFNPISNSEVVIEIIKAQASFEGTALGHLEKQERLIIPPGLYTTPRIPITYASGIGGNILRKALNGDLKVHGDAMFKFILDEFQLDLVYSGNGLTANVRL